jgi:purine-nucleoside phosphorylase
MQGLSFIYEGYRSLQVTFRLEFCKIRYPAFLLSNAAGINQKTSKKGDLVLLDDHINLQGGSPLSGLNSFEYGGIFPDMSAL